MSKVSLVSMTNEACKVGEIYEACSPEELILEIARVSTPLGKRSGSTNLLKYLMQHKHWSPFEMVDLTFKIVTSRAISAQLIRHRSFSFQEFSQRYSEVTEFETCAARRQDLKNRQNSVDDVNREDKAWFLQAQQIIQELAINLYEQALNKKIAKECARVLLPMSAQTILFMKGSVRSWLHYFMLRLDKATQLEHREIANQIFDIFALQ